MKAILVGVGLIGVVAGVVDRGWWCPTDGTDRPVADGDRAVERSFGEAERSFAADYGRAGTGAGRAVLISRAVDRYSRLLSDLAPPEERRQAEGMMRRALATNPSREVRGHLAYLLGLHLERRAEMAWRPGPAAARGLAASSLGYFDRVVADYGDIRVGGGRTLGGMATEQSAQIRRLGPGREAPEIEGRDLDGRPMRLGDYRGRVVALYFWAGWCPLCRGSFADARALVRRLEGRPFALVGVNSDHEVEGPRTIRREGLTPWRSFWDGAPGGPIATAWGVSPWPALFLLDRDGVIRLKYVGQTYDPRELDEAIDHLLAEAEGRSPRRRGLAPGAEVARARLDAAGSRPGDPPPLQ